MGTEKGFTRQAVAPASVKDDLDWLLLFAGCDAFLASTGSLVTADGTEQTLYIDSEPLGAFNGRTVYVDLDNMQGGDTTDFRVYYRIADGGNFLLQDYQSYTGADGGLTNGKKLIAITLGPNRHGVHVTLQQTAGTNRAYTYEVFMEGQQ